MKILADADIPYVEEAFATLGEVRTLPSEQILHESLEDADILLVRSVTTVTAKLLAGSRVRYVATPTAGVEHIDAAGLAAAKVAWSHAPGCNADAVAEWVYCVLLQTLVEQNLSLDRLTLGVIGVGQVGSRVARIGRALVLTVLLNDPPRARQEGSAQFVTLDELLAKSDILSLHVPSIDEGPDRTVDLLHADRLQNLEETTIVINSSRGSAVNEAALVERLSKAKLAAALLDVWQGEPQIAKSSINMVSLGTPHIAGYTRDAKARGTQMIFDAACAFAGRRDLRWQPSLPPADPALIECSVGRRSEEEVLHEILQVAFPVWIEDDKLRQAQHLPDEDIGPLFTRLRKECPLRREFGQTIVRLKKASERCLQRVKALGFQVVTA